MSQTKIKRKVLTSFNLIMINVIAVASLRTLPIGAEFGASVIFYYLLAAIAFFIPVALVTAELATGWPSTGGIYVWVREAFGKRSGFFIIWLQWLYNVIWYPTILSFVAATITYLFDPTLADNKTYLLVTVLIMFWASTVVNFFGMKISSLVSTIGALVGTIIPMLFIIVLGVIWLVSGKPLAISFDHQNLLPQFDHAKNIAFFTGILFGLVGIEMSAMHAGDVKNPKRDYPIALIYSVIIVVVLLMFASLAITLVIQPSQLNLLSGVMHAFTLFFEALHMAWIVPILALLIAFGAFCQIATWVIGPTKGLLVASQDGVIPAVFAKVNKHGVPVTILIAQAVVVTLLSFMFVLFPKINSSYWVLTAMTSQLSLIEYCLLFVAFIYLRYKKAHVERAFRVPAGKFGAFFLAGLGFVTCALAIIFGFFPPNDFASGDLWKFETILICGTIVFGILPFVIYYFFYHKLTKKVTKH